MTTQMIREAIETLHQAFEEFKSTNEERLTHLETKGKNEPFLDEKMNRLNATLDKAQDRLTHLETASRRPFFSDVVESNTSEKAAFTNYVRKGIEAFEQKALTSLNEASGGYLIPSGMLNKIHETMVIYSPLRKYARVTSISTDALELLQEKKDADVGWVAETADRPETATPELQKIRISVHQIYVKPRASQKLLDDASIDIESWLAHKIAEKMMMTENMAFVAGDGNGKPKGFLTYELTPLGKGEWGKFEAVTTKSQDNLIESDLLFEIFHALKTQFLKGAIWIMSRSAIAAIRKLKDSNKQYLWQPSMMEGTPPTLLGCPVVIADEMPALEKDKTATAIAFGNFHEAYQIVDRAGLHILRDPFSAKPYVEFYATKRVGGDVINFDALKFIHFTQG